jgi:hypothetical protein
MRNFFLKVFTTRGHEGQRGTRCDVKIEKKCYFLVDGAKFKLGNGKTDASNTEKHYNRRGPRNKKIRSFVPDIKF